MAFLATVFGLEASLQGQPPAANPQDDLFLFPPDTPSRQIRGALLAEQLGRPDLGRRYLRQVVEAELTSEQLQQLRAEFGIGQFLKLSAVQELQPSARKLLRLINATTRQEAPSSGTVEILISELGQSDKQTLNASLRILSADKEAVVPLLSTDPETQQGKIAERLLHNYVRRFRFGLLQALPDASEEQQIRILNLLGRSADPHIISQLQVYRFAESRHVSDTATQTIYRLSGRLPTESAPETARLLTSQALALLSFVGQPFPSEFDRREIGVPQASKSQAESEAVWGTASLAYAAELAGWAATIDSDSVEVQATQQVVQMTSAAWPTSWPETPSVPAEASSNLATEVEIAAMNIAIESGHAGAMLAMLQRPDQAFAVLNQRADLLRQLTFQSDARVRLLAAAFRNAIGGESSASRAILQHAVDARPQPQAVVIDSRSGEARNTKAVLNASGYGTAAAVTGQGGFDLATERMSCELVAIHSNCLRWSLSETVTNLRKDYRTAQTPIVIYGPERDHRSFETLAHRFDGLWFLREPLSEITFADAIRLAGVPTPKLTDDERVNMINYARTLTLTD